jgi:hypothetical protein|tara:strand:- start:56 stop:943 length:888 start_codon:yes stop_codon:yes gene_type:complete
MSEFDYTGKISSGAGAFDNFKSGNVVNGTKEFLESNSLVAKIAFLLLILVVFVIAVKFSSRILSWLFSYNQSPYLVDGMINSKKQMVIIPQDPNTNGSIPIVRSDNEERGIEFTYSTWIFIDDLVYQEGQYRHIFHKGNDNINYTNQPIGMNQPNNAPGLYIAPNTNALVVVMNTFNDIEERVTIDDIPLNKWICVQIRVENHQLDTYINGKLTKRLIMKGVPKQNYGNVYVGMNGGFSGYLSNLRYFNYGLGTSEIQNIVDSGPDLTMKSGDMTESMPKYLSLRWFFDGNGAGI